jgi:MFS family permease
MARLAAADTDRTELQGTAALTAVAMLLGVAFALSTLVTPLYLIYQQEFGFSQITLTLIYAAYAIGNITALLFFGHVPDCVGRRPTALSAIAILIVAALVFLFANGVAALHVARILAGLGIGVASGAGNAWLAELVCRSDKTRAASIGTSSNFLGLGLAALLSGLLAQYAPGRRTCRSSSISSSCVRSRRWFRSPRKLCGIPAASSFARSCRYRGKSARNS